MTEDLIFPSTQSSHTLNLNIKGRPNSVPSYVHYSKTLQSRLAEINNNVSDMIKESCNGIDNICNKVRDCLWEMNLNKDSRKIFAEEEELKECTSDGSISKSSDEVKQDSDEIAEIEKFQSIIENEHEIDHINENVNPTKSMTPFFTVLDFEDKKDSNECEPLASQCPLEANYHTVQTILEENVKQCSNVLETFRETILKGTVCEHFEVMNEIVDNINEEINIFSKTTLQGEHAHLENNPPKQLKAVSPPATKQKVIKRLTSSNSRHQSVQVNNSLTYQEDYFSLKRHNSKFVFPDVYRKRAFTNIFRRLVGQLEANDSLIFFQNLMKRETKHKIKTDASESDGKLLDVPIMNYSRPKKSVTASNSKASCRGSKVFKKYAGSLWFSQSHIKESQSRSKGRPKSRDVTAHSKNASPKVIKEALGSKPLSSKIRGGRKSRGDAKAIKDIKDKACPLECTCRMIVQNDLPPTPTTKCRLHWMRVKAAQAPHRKLQYLDILDDLTNKDLLPLQSEYPRKDNLEPRRAESTKAIEDTYLYKLMYGKQGTKSVWKQLLEPSVECSKQGCKICKRPRSQLGRVRKTMDLQKPDRIATPNINTGNLSQSEVLKKLSPYMHDPEKQKNYSHSITVMPVHVYYDNFKPGEMPPTKQSICKSLSTKKVSFLPQNKGIKTFKKAEWSAPGISKPKKVVYDCLPKKIEMAPAATPQAIPATSKPIIVNSARLSTEKQTTIKAATSRSFSPKSYAPLCCDDTRLRKNTNKAVTNAVKPANMAIYSRIQADIDKIKNDIYMKNMNELNRKIWQNKYGKSVGQQLLSFIEHQEEETVTPVPKYATPKFQSPPAEKKSVVGRIQDHTPRKQMLLHLHGLKQKNDAIQGNIQKAIDVIENKMVDILSADSNSVEAFDIMEKEISNVLNMMKSNKKKMPNIPEPKSIDMKDDKDTENDSPLSYDFNSISDQLFQRLQKILDSGKSTVASIHSDSSESSPEIPKKEEAKRKLPYRKNKNDKIMSAPTSSTSLDEKVTRNSSPKSTAKKKERTGKKTKLSAPTPVVPIESAAKENILLMPAGDQNPTVSTPTKEKKTAQSPEVEEDQEARKEQDSLMMKNSRGDFTTQEDIIKCTNNLVYTMEIANQTQENSNNKEKEIIEVKVKSVPLAVEVETVPAVPNISKLDEFIDDIINKSPNETSKFQDFIDEIFNESDNPMINAEKSLALVHSGSSSNQGNAKDPLCELSSAYCTPCESPKMADNQNITKVADSSTSFSDQVHKIILRVEDIYSHLDDIQNTESSDIMLPCREKRNVIDVNSEIFLTPFMQAVKENRRSSEVAKMPEIQRSPSYYNVLRFLDSLNAMAVETSIEIHIARLHVYIKVCRECVVFYQAEIWNEAIFTPAKYEIQHSPKIMDITPENDYSTSTYDKTSCLKKIGEEIKQMRQKKVSFFVQSEDKSCQAVICPIHKHNIIKISSQQFPPLEKTTEQEISEKITELDVNIKYKGDNDISLQKQSQLKTKDIILLHDVSGKESASETTNELDHESSININTSTQVFCQVLDKPTSDICSDLELKNQDLNAGCREIENNLDVSQIDERSTGKVCNTKKEGSTKTNSFAEEYTQTVNSDNPLLKTKSMGDDLLENSSIDIYYDYSKDYGNRKSIRDTLEKVYDGIYGEQSMLHVRKSLEKIPKGPTKVVVFREVLEAPDLLQPLKNLKDFSDFELYEKCLSEESTYSHILTSIQKSKGKLVSKPTARSVNVDDENVVLLKSFYAIVYILMFTALSLDYRCL